ncbi:MAG TPA: cupin domain-containing protein [Chloroflexota bacterium]|nr:cupin domain-containing protein [Chloroflexota bacterium]
MAEGEQRQTMDLPETGVFDPHAFRHFSKEGATVVRLHADEDLSLVTWNLEEGQENQLHRHGDNAHTILILEGSGEYLRGEGQPGLPVRTGECIVVPRGQPHGIRNTGKGRLSYLAVTNQGAHGYVKERLAGGGE